MYYDTWKTTAVNLLGREMLARYVDRPLNRNAKVVRHV